MHFWEEGISSQDGGCAVTQRAWIVGMIASISGVEETEEIKVSIGQMTKIENSGTLISVEQLGPGCEGLICRFCQILWHRYSNMTKFKLPMCWPWL